MLRRCLTRIAKKPFETRSLTAYPGLLFTFLVGFGVNHSKYLIWTTIYTILLYCHLVI